MNYFDFDPYSRSSIFILNARKFTILLSYCVPKKPEEMPLEQLWAVHIMNTNAIRLKHKKTEIFVTVK